MASLMEELIVVLDEENDLYKKLLELSLQKTPVLVAADLEKLNDITMQEQTIVDSLSRADKKREQCMKDIANVINVKKDELTLSYLVDMLSARPQEQKKLATISDELGETVALMRRSNEQNKVLIESSLEMVEFDLNVLSAMKAAPETANYSKDAYSTGNVIGVERSKFDSKS